MVKYVENHVGKGTCFSLSAMRLYFPLRSLTWGWGWFKRSQVSVVMKSKLAVVEELSENAAGSWLHLLVC